MIWHSLTFSQVSNHPRGAAILIWARLQSSERWGPPLCFCWLYMVCKASALGKRNYEEIKRSANLQNYTEIRYFFLDGRDEFNRSWQKYHYGIESSLVFDAASNLTERCNRTLTQNFSVWIEIQNFKPRLLHHPLYRVTFLLLAFIKDATWRGLSPCTIDKTKNFPK